MGPSSPGNYLVDPLREQVNSLEANWKMSQFAPRVVWQEITDLKRAVAEIQDRMEFFINKVNNCKPCREKDSK